MPKNYTMESHASWQPSHNPLQKPEPPIEKPKPADLIRARYNVLRSEVHQKKREVIQNLPEWKLKEALNKAQKDIERLYEEENAELGALNLIAARELKKAAKAIAKTNKVKWIQNEKNKTAEKSVRGLDKMRLRKNQSQASSVKLEVKDQLLKGSKI